MERFAEQWAEQQRRRNLRVLCTCASCKGEHIKRVVTVQRHIATYGFLDALDVSSKLDDDDGDHLQVYYFNLSSWILVAVIYKPIWNNMPNVKKNYQKFIKIFV